MPEHRLPLDCLPPQTKDLLSTFNILDIVNQQQSKSYLLELHWLFLVHPQDQIVRATKQSWVTLIWQQWPHRGLVLSRESILLMGFSRYLLFAEDSTFHLGFINGPYSKASYHQGHIKSSSFLLGLSLPASIFFASLSFGCFILIPRNSAWDTFIRVPPAIAILLSTAPFPHPVNPRFPSSTKAHLPSHCFPEFPSINSEVLLISIGYVSHCILLQAILVATSENKSFLSVKTSTYTCDKES